MKNIGEGGGGRFLMKQIISTVSSLGRAKSLARLLKNKANALRTRLIIFSQLREKRLMTSSITQKIHSLTSHHRRNEDHNDCHAVDDVSSSNIKSPSSITMILPIKPTVNEEEEAYSERSTTRSIQRRRRRRTATRSIHIFESDMDQGPGSVIEMVKNEKGGGFKLEEEIDRVADLFIEKFHRQEKLLFFSHGAAGSGCIMIFVALC